MLPSVLAVRLPQFSGFRLACSVLAGVRLLPDPWPWFGPSIPVPRSSVSSRLPVRQVFDLPLVGVLAARFPGPGRLWLWPLAVACLFSFSGCPLLLFPLPRGLVVRGLRSRRSLPGSRARGVGFRPPLFAPLPLSCRCFDFFLSVRVPFAMFWTFPPPFLFGAFATISAAAVSLATVGEGCAGKMLFFFGRRSRPGALFVLFFGYCEIYLFTLSVSIVSLFP